MKRFTQKDIKTLFSNLCCSRCKNDFTLESLRVIEKSGDLMICNLTCKKCDKDFGEIVFNFAEKSKEHLPLEIIDGPAPISVDDVIDAHEFIKKLR